MNEYTFTLIGYGPTWQIKTTWGHILSLGEKVSRESELPVYVFQDQKLLVTYKTEGGNFSRVITGRPV